MLTLSGVIDKISTDEGYDELEVMFNECSVDSLLAEYTSVFGSDLKIFLENNLNNTEDAVAALKLIAMVEGCDLHEVLVKRVTSRGVISRVKDRKTRARLATQTTGMAKAKRRQIARRAAKTKKANPSGKIRALRKRKRAMARRKSMGI